MKNDGQSKADHPVEAAPEDICKDVMVTDGKLRECERSVLFGSQAQPIDLLQGTALAISGGGIRSASFALGVLQSLFEAKCFQRFDYLSTVSGGGYLGSAISWLRRETARGVAPTDRDARFTQQFGWAGAGARHFASPRSTPSSAATQSTPEPSNIWLDYIRQHGNYLQPGSISTAALIATALRGAIFNLAVYGLLLTALVAFLVRVRYLPNGHDPNSWLEPPWYRIECWTLLFGGLFTSSVMLYGFATWVSSLRRATAIAMGLIALVALAMVTVVLITGYGMSTSVADSGLNWRWPATAGAVASALVAWSFVWTIVKETGDGSSVKSSRQWHYLARVTYVDWLGTFLIVSIALLVLWSVPYVNEILKVKIGSLVAGGASAIVGALGGVYQFVIGREQKGSSSAAARLRILGSALLLIYGLVLLSHWFAMEYLNDASNLEVGVLVAVALLLGLLINTNYYGLGRMYRDRLMEAFMPNMGTIRANTWSPATDADRAALVDFRFIPLHDAASSGTPESPPATVVQRPLHLINCCAVMINASSDTFRGRGGDSFLLSPWFSGSYATGWVASGLLGDGRLTLATAVAISGAAANPDAGVAGRGLTRNRLVAFLMSLLNVRLGYWLPNPRLQGSSGKTFAPNLWRPGLRQGLLGTGLNESAAYVEVTDGGHFDNTALYELIRRRVAVIVLCEAGQDGEYRMDDLANAIEKVRVDFGTHIRFEEPEPDPEPQSRPETAAAAQSQPKLQGDPETKPLPLYDLAGIRPHKKSGLSRRGFAIGKIRYPKTRDPSVDPQYDEGTLIYLQAVPVEDMRPDTDSYRRQNPKFPNESTADQFFSEEQLEAYRELGLRVGRAAMEAVRNGKDSKYEPVARAHRALQPLG